MCVVVVGGLVVRRRQGWRGQGVGALAIVRIQTACAEAEGGLCQCTVAVCSSHTIIAGVCGCTVHLHLHSSFVGQPCTFVTTNPGGGEYICVAQPPPPIHSRNQPPHFPPPPPHTRPCTSPRF